MSDDGVKIVADHCNTVYMNGNGFGDIGQNIAEFRPELIGVDGREEFIELVEQAHEQGLTERKSDGLGYILANNSNIGLERIIEEGVGAQRPEDYAEGFIRVCDENFDVHVITAGIDEIAERSMNARMNGYTPHVTGTSLAQNGSGVEVDSYCAGNEKLHALRDHYEVESLADKDIIAFGNSDSNDGPMMEEAPIAIGRERAYDSADIYVQDDPEFWTRATLTGIASEILDGDNPKDRGLKFAMENPGHLEDIESGGNPGEYAEEVLEAYQDVRREVM